MDNNIKLVRKLQHTLVKSRQSKLLAVRKGTQDNTGKKTAGVDGILFLTPRVRLKLGNELKLDGKSSAVRRVWIPKPGTDENRPLGIPTIRDRALKK